MSESKSYTVFTTEIMTWDEALLFAARSEWIMPTIKELETMLYMVPEYLESVGSEFRSCEKFNRELGMARYMDFITGMDGYTTKERKLGEYLESVGSEFWSCEEFNRELGTARYMDFITGMDGYTTKERKLGVVLIRR